MTSQKRFWVRFHQTMRTRIARMKAVVVRRWLIVAFITFFPLYFWKQVAEPKSEIVSRVEPDPHWFSEDCEGVRRRFLYYLNINLKIDSQFNRQKMVTARRDFKSSVRRCRYKYAKTKADKLINARLQNAKQADVERFSYINTYYH